MRIGIDVDGVLADFNTSFIERVIAVTGKDLFPPRPFEIPTWDYPQHYGYTNKECSAVWESIKADTSFWFNLGAYATTADDVQRLHELNDGDNDIYFITSRPGVEAKEQTEMWLIYQGYNAAPTVLISSEKGLCAKALKLDLYIDDRWENVKNVVETEPTCQTYLFDRPWNQHADPSFRSRVSSVRTAFALYSGLFKKVA